jgi:hypothetical protein
MLTYKYYLHHTATVKIIARFFMSEFTDFMTMKIIEERRMLKGRLNNKEIELHLLEELKAVKNLNVRAPITTIALVESLASWTNSSKAELVLEMLDSCINESLDMIEKEGNLDIFMNNHYANLEKNYDVTLTRDEDGNVVTFKFKDTEIKNND